MEVVIVGQGYVGLPVAVAAAEAGHRVTGIDVDEGRIESGRVFNRTTCLDGVPDGYRAMNNREAIKVMVRP